ncbi:MAG TPA: hypothetical protein VLD85_13055 [Anaeromyxobacteraceae bacterium]|nr:hypothetical protein [Anaeromyxobacteraceae bacterium]
MNAVPGPEELKALIKLESRVEAQRSLYCDRYGSCLDQAVLKGWTSWTCARCPMFDGEVAADAGRREQARH